VISGDVRGGIREWPLPTRLVRVAATTSSRFNMAIFDGATRAIAATTWRPELTIVEPSGATRTVGPHGTDSIFLEQARNGRTFAAFGLNDVVELWSSRAMTRTRLVNTGHGSVSQLHFVDDSDDFVTSGHDGRLVRWTSSGQATQIARADQPIDRFAPVATGAIVFSTVDGALWRTDASGQVVRLRGAGPRINRILAVTDPVRVYAGYASGDVVAIDAASWQLETVLHGTGSIYEMAASRDGRTVAIATTEGTVHVGLRDAAAPAKVVWTTWAARARAIAMSPDGLVLATYSDGTIWLYEPVRRRWLCMPSGTVDLARAAVAPGGEAAVVADIEGRLISIDLTAARAQLARGEVATEAPHTKER
jgi:WD40 repeat protein